MCVCVKLTTAAVRWMKRRNSLPPQKNYTSAHQFWRIPRQRDRTITFHTHAHRHSTRTREIVLEVFQHKAGLLAARVVGAKGDEELNASQAGDNALADRHTAAGHVLHRLVVKQRQLLLRHLLRKYKGRRGGREEG